MNSAAIAAERAQATATATHARRQLPAVAAMRLLMAGAATKPAAPEAVRAMAIARPRYRTNQRVMVVASGIIVPRAMPIPMRKPNPTR